MMVPLAKRDYEPRRSRQKRKMMRFREKYVGCLRHIPVEMLNGKADMSLKPSEKDGLGLKLWKPSEHSCYFRSWDWVRLPSKHVLNGAVSQGQNPRKPSPIRNLLKLGSRV